MRDAEDSRPLRPPAHVAVIMDGNGRWAKSRGLPRTAGHKKGVDAVRRTVEAAGDLGIGYLTIFSFSSENWRRPEEEVSDLMQLLRFYLRSEIADLHRNGVRLRVIGDRARLSKDIVGLIDNAETLTRDNRKLTLVVALSYGSRQEITLAARRLAEEVKAGTLDPADITEDRLSERLFTADIPDPDLIVRTSGEKRISNFLLWQAAYAELVFVDTLWPDFSKRDLEAAIEEFHRRERRFGATTGTR
ncbi:isoprenyl transferase [Azospirillum brasilense]|uniref:Isoprenyl transferase n=1 Tax=Azospirillum brasilense TaxID=192 RepID=A0A0N7I7P4_AZOBR|nr:MULTISPECIES: isoprenyl transferase [Azospirillum]ALJ35059.1 UDP pyrophosphate synthase [Azospirillum brasilense]MDW7553553.1 isoprenyl transferase [Azospirillum brasilense]MDW7594241.1 isoprenyl transferase [Azospirillum brasilense]MDW7629113.1 isoprenyl transferase [Azospirillum brasilense]MDX5953744.1 isoprenyl transferase [Azospirillum brasilense]